MAVTQSPTHNTTDTRRSPSRSNSFDNNPKSDSNMNGHTSRHISDDEFSILGSDQVTNENILTNLKQAKQEPQILKIELEDFLTSGHHSLLPVVKALFTCDERDWKRIRFFDTIEEADFALWQGIKTKIMRDYEDSLPDHLLEFLTVETQLVVPEVTPDVLLPLLKKLPQDEDIVAMTFGGALEGVDPADIPDELDHCLHEHPDGGITIDLVCGWQDEEAEEDTEWIDLCAACRDVLKDYKNNNRDQPQDLQPPSLTRNKSAPVQGAAAAREPPSGRETPVRMPSRRMQRGVSRDEVEEHQQQQLAANPKQPPARRNTDPNLMEDDESNMDASKPREVPRMPSRGGRLSRQAPDRTKSLGVLPSRSSSAADRLALLGAGGSRRVGSRRVPDGRALPERSASGRRTPTRTSSRKVPDAGGPERSLPQRTNSRRGPPARSSSRKVSRQEEVEALEQEAN